jgi:3-(3-hydroxy-phenyl)propionate hydroxylase
MALPLIFGISGASATIRRERRPAGRLIDLYDRQRRTVPVEFVQEQSIANKKRLEARDPEARWRNPGELRATAADPERGRQFLLRTSMSATQRRADAITLEEV